MHVIPRYTGEPEPGKKILTVNELEAVVKAFASEKANVMTRPSTASPG